MKKVLFLFFICLGTSTLLIANNSKKLNNLPQGEQKEKTNKAKQPKKYDFSLFKFISPVKVKQADTSKSAPPKRKFKVVPKEVSAFHQEKPRSFFMFS